MATENNGYTGDRRPDNGNDGTPPSGSENLGDITRGQGTDRLSDKNWESIDEAVSRAHDSEPVPGESGSIGIQAADYLAHVLDADENPSKNKGNNNREPLTNNTGPGQEQGYETRDRSDYPLDDSVTPSETTKDRDTEGDLPDSTSLPEDKETTDKTIGGPEGSDANGEESFFDGIDPEGKISDNEKSAIDDAFKSMDEDNDRDLDLDDDEDGKDLEDLTGPGSTAAAALGGATAANALDDDKTSDKTPSDGKDGQQKGRDQDNDRPGENDTSSANAASDRQDISGKPEDDQESRDRDRDDQDQQGKEPQKEDGQKEGPELEPSTGDGGDGNGNDGRDKGDKNAHPQDATTAPVDNRLGGTDGGRGLEASAPKKATPSPFDNPKKPQRDKRKGDPKDKEKPPISPGLTAAPAAMGLMDRLSPFGDSPSSGDDGDIADATSGQSPFDMEPQSPQGKDKKLSPFDDAKAADGFGDGGGGVDPSKNTPARRKNSDLANNVGNNDRGDNGGGRGGGGGGGGGGKPPRGGGPPPALPPSDDDKGGFFSPAKMLKNPIVIVLLIVLGLVGGLLMITNTANVSNQQNAGPMVCDMDSQTEAFKTSNRGVPDGEYSKPALMPTGVFTSGFGARWGTQHLGDDIADADNSELFAYDDGTVLYSGSADGFGHWIVLDHFGTDDGDFSSLYGHMYGDDLFVNVGDDVKAGEVIALMGNDGGSTGTHLHFEIHPGGYGNPVDPRGWVEKAVNPGETSSRQDIDSLGDDEEEESEEDANASSSTRSFTSLNDEHTVQPATDSARSVQGGPDIINNSNRTLVIAGEEYAAPKGSDNERQLDATLKYTMEGANVEYVDAWHGEAEYRQSIAYSPFHEYYHGRWEGLRFIPAKEDIRHVDDPRKQPGTAQTRGGIRAAINELKDTDKNHLDNYGRIVISVNDLKRYKPARMPYNPSPGPKPLGWVPKASDMNWVDKGWWVDTGLGGATWVDNPYYLEEATKTTIDGQHPGWREVGQSEIRELINLANEKGVKVYFATGPGPYGVVNDNNGDNNTDYIQWAVDQGLIPADHVIDWADFANPGEYDSDRGGLDETGAQKFADATRIVAWGENRDRLPTGGTKGFEYGKDSQLPSNDYESPYRDTNHRGGNRKMNGYEGGYKIANGDKLTHDAMTIAQAIQEQFPEVQTIGGWRPSDPYPDHPSGRAVDVMIPDYSTTRGKNLGKEINEYILANEDFFNVEYTIWAQEYFPAGGDSNMMEDRGSDTQNHFDHVHITVNEPGNQNKGDARGAKADESHYYGPFPERDGSPMSASGTSGFSTCCPSTGSQEGNNDSGNYAGSGNVVSMDEVIIRNSAVIIEAGREMDLPEGDIMIALMTAAGETGGGFQNYANDGANWAQSGSSNVPPEVLRESLNYPHDAVGHDAASVGVFQQQVGYWGTVEDLMIHEYQTGQFYAEMENKSASSAEYGESDYGLAAATIQVNQPGRAAYDQYEGLARELLDSYDGEHPLSNTGKKDLERGYKNRKNGTSSDGSGGETGGSKASSTQNQKDRALNGGCGVSGSIRRNNQVRYDEGSAEAIVEAARDQIGVSYAWGGGNADGPSEGMAPDEGVIGFDCSGLTMYAAAQAGITLPRTTGDQIKEGKAIGDIKDAKPGDLIFWEGHVAVYSGDGKVIHAPQSGEKVREQDVWDTAGQPITGIRRIATDQ